MKQHSTSIWVLSTQTLNFAKILLKFCCKFLAFLAFCSFLSWKTLKMTISTSLECAAPKCWSKYTTDVLQRYDPHQNKIIDVNRWDSKGSRIQIPVREGFSFFSWMNKKNFFIFFCRSQYSCELGSNKFYAFCGFGGFMACGTTHLIMTPLDIVKCRLQVIQSSNEY